MNQQSNGHNTVNGTVERVKQDGKRTAVKLGGEWYSTFKPVPPVAEGDQVALAYRRVAKGERTFLDIEDLTVERSQRAEREAHIDRSVALKAASMEIVSTISLMLESGRAQSCVSRNAACGGDGISMSFSKSMMGLPHDHRR